MVRQLLTQPVPCRLYFSRQFLDFTVLSTAQARLRNYLSKTKNKTKTVWNPDLYAKLQSILTTSTTTDLEVQGDDVMSEDVEVLRLQRSPVQCHGIPTAVGRARLGVGGLVDEVGGGG